MKQVKCASNMRSISLNFQFFAEGNSEAGRGDSEQLGRSRFRVNDFQESLYGIDEFWDLGDRTSGQLSSRSDLMLCSAGPAQLTKRSGHPCGRDSLTPAADVTLAVNMRLHRAVVEFGGMSLLSPVSATNVRTGILNHPYVPLVIDVDGAQAVERGLDPFYIAPPRTGSDDPYADGRYWSPSTRHGGGVNVAFVGGHVLSSKDPASEGWNWGYEANVGR